MFRAHESALEAIGEYRSLMPLGREPGPLQRLEGHAARLQGPHCKRAKGFWNAVGLPPAVATRPDRREGVDRSIAQYQAMGQGAIDLMKRAASRVEECRHHVVPLRQRPARKCVLHPHDPGRRTRPQGARGDVENDASGCAGARGRDDGRSVAGTYTGRVQRRTWRWRYGGHFTDAELAGAVRDGAPSVVSTTYRAMAVGV